MLGFTLQLLLLSAEISGSGAAAVSRKAVSAGPTPFEIDLSASVPHMLDLIKNTNLPSKPEYPGLGATLGIDLDLLKGLQRRWTSTFNWDKEQSALNKYSHFTTVIEGQTIHFIHEQSAQADAIPLILFHGWPGSFLEFIPVITPLTQKAKTLAGKPVSFHVVVASLPGFAFSAPAPHGWTAEDTARIFDTLMTTVLGYSTYAVHGTDWGSGIAYYMYEKYNQTARAGHFAFLPFWPYTTEQLAQEGITLDSIEQYEQDRQTAWSLTGDAYFLEQTTRPNGIGLALYDNPVGQLAWIGEKFVEWSDPAAGTAPSVLDHNEILLGVSLYYLTKCFVSSVFQYADNSDGFRKNYTKAPTDAPLLFSQFKQNVGFWPPELVAKVGNLVYYQNHDFGGHFAGLDNPPALIQDLREIATYWTQ